MQSIVSLAIAVLIIGLVVWMKIRGRKRPIKRNGFGILAPILVVFPLMSFSLYQMMHIPGKPFHFPPYWELLIAGLLGILLGVIMLNQTTYERREDGLIYPKPNKNFKFVIIAIVAIRIMLAQYLKSMDYIELTVLTMFMALLYLGIWRIGSFVKFRSVSALK
ncbi:CcdC protein domain-containing protein [Brevibacillus massiliensis]|uniref:CcdC protein domain-containing protein n=1 Tax=Brevibacillus massiliensis TaxID=1118054 RepID=UPI0002E64B29|nr:CcdC protein domain-containing protein [Brevibacillus massiliensis]